MNKYRAVKDKNTGQWTVEKIDPFFDLPIVVDTLPSRAKAFEVVKRLMAVAYCHANGY